MDICSEFNQIHLELKCGEQMFRDVFIDLPVHLEQYETGDFKRFLQKLVVKDKVGLQLCEIPRQAKRNFGRKRSDSGEVMKWTNCG